MRVALSNVWSDMRYGESDRDVFRPYYQVTKPLPLLIKPH